MSNYYGRIYDKHRESRDDAYARCWRYEVEAKGAGAEATRRFVNNVKGEAGALASFVEAWFRNRGLDVRYRSGLAFASEAIGADPTDDIRSLQWLRAAAAPAIARLGERYTRAALIHWLFDGASMESMRADAEAIRGIELKYAERSNANGSRLDT